MSFVIRGAAQRAIPRARGFASAAGKGSYHEQQQAMIAHAGGAFNSFRDVTVSRNSFPSAYRDHGALA